MAGVAPRPLTLDVESFRRDSTKLPGHRKIATTSTYLSATSEDLHRAFCAVKSQKAEGGGLRRRLRHLRLPRSPSTDLLQASEATRLRGDPAADVAIEGALSQN